MQFAVQFNYTLANELLDSGISMHISNSKVSQGKYQSISCAVLPVDSVDILRSALSQS